MVLNIKTIVFLLMCFLNMSAFSFNAGTHIWDTSVKNKRPLGVLFTITGMGAAPLFIPYATYETSKEKDMNWFVGALTGFGLGTLWMMVYEVAGVTDIITIGGLSCDGKGTDVIGNIGEALIKPAYCYYIDSIDNQIEDWQKAAEKKRNQEEYLRKKKEREEKAAKEAEKKKQEEAKPEDKETHSWIKDN